MKMSDIVLVAGKTRVFKKEPLRHPTVFKRHQLSVCCNCYLIKLQKFVVLSLITSQCLFEVKKNRSLKKITSGKSVPICRIFTSSVTYM